LLQAKRERRNTVKHALILALIILTTTVSPAKAEVAWRDADTGAHITVTKGEGLLTLKCGDTWVYQTLNDRVPVYIPRKVLETCEGWTIHEGNLAQAKTCATALPTTHGQVGGDDGEFLSGETLENAEAMLNFLRGLR
jgi:hypothetical protein